MRTYDGLKATTYCDVCNAELGLSAFTDGERDLCEKHFGLTGRTTLVVDTAELAKAVDELLQSKPAKALMELVERAREDEREAICQHLESLGHADAAAVIRARKP